MTIFSSSASFPGNLKKKKKCDKDTCSKYLNYAGVHLQKQKGPFLRTYKESLLCIVEYGL